MLRRFAFRVVSRFELPCLLLSCYLLLLGLPTMGGRGLLLALAGGWFLFRWLLSKLIAAPHKYNSSRPQCGSPMQCSAEKKEKKMTCLECKAKTHLHLTSPLIQMTKHHNEIDASIGSNNSLYAMCQREMQTRSLI